MTAEAPDNKDLNEDPLDTSSAPLLDHLIELRTRLIKGVIGLFFGFIICFYFSAEIFDFLAQPYLWIAANDTGTALLAEGEKVLPKDQQFITTVAYEFFSVKLTLGLYGGLFLAFPFIAIQIYRFVAPGLYKNEKRAFLPFLIATPLLFILSFLVLYFIMLPAILYFFNTLENYSYASTISIKHTPKVNQYIDFVLKMVFGAGIAFQLPVILCLLGKIGIVSSEWLASSRRFAIVIIITLSALLTPADPYSMFVLFLPLYMFFEISIVIIKDFEKKREHNHKNIVP